MRLVLGFLGALAAQAASAQEVTDCQVLARLGVSMDPSTLSQRAYANGTVALAVVHDPQRDPTAAQLLIVFTADLDDEDQRACYAVGQSAELGYAQLAAHAASAEFTAAEGLTLTVPVQKYMPEEKQLESTVLFLQLARNSRALTVIEGLESG